MDTPKKKRLLSPEHRDRKNAGDRERRKRQKLEDAFEVCPACLYVYCA